MYCKVFFRSGVFCLEGYQRKGSTISKQNALLPRLTNHANQWIYRKILIISPGFIFVQKAVLLGLFLGELIFGGAYYWKELRVSKWVGLDDENSLKHHENSPWAYNYSGGLIISGGYTRLRFGGLLFGQGLLGILRY